jgi:imidazolonepropionase-like amidohydrolase
LREPGPYGRSGLHRHAYDPAEALVAATINSAHALGPRWAADLGSLEPASVPTS